MIDHHYTHVPILKREKPLTIDQIKEGIRRIGGGSDESLEFQALDTLLDTLLMDTVGDVAEAENNDPFACGRNSGALDIILQIKGKLLAFRKDPTPD